MTLSEHRLFVLFVSLLIASGCKQQPETQGLSLSESLSTFELAEGFQIELIAAEPLISDPVAMEIDEHGNMYVVEMHGYPLDKSGSGKVKLLRDTDGDGVMDEAVAFADNLKFPTGVMRWKKGILVTDPPNLLYLEDLDGDGRADTRDTLLTGFAISNPQHNFNNPFFGLDNWIYLANEPATTAKVYTEEFSDLGSQVVYKKGKGPVLPQNSGGRRVRLKPDEFKLEALSSASQFGHTIDQWGRHFLVSNANHIYHEVMPAQYLSRNPELLVSNATAVLSDHGPAAEVYPITQNPEHQLLTDLGVFTAACGITAYTGGLFPEPFNEAVFVAEPVGNLVHVDRIKEAGASFAASRMYDKKEFLASTDPWFRPVNHYVGPDGALYVVDYYRRVIEHPEWMAEDAASKSNLYDGIDQGRIYRITPTGTPKTTWTSGLDLGESSGAELVQYLGDPNAWYRRNAQRLLLDRKDTALIPQLNEMLRSASTAHGRLHAAWTLHGFDALGTGDIMGLLQDPEPGLRENAIRLAEDFLEEEELVKDLVSLRSDPSSRVRFQLLNTLGEINSPLVNRIREEMLFEHLEDNWMQMAALSARQPDYNGLLATAVDKFGADVSVTSLVQRVSSMLAASGSMEGLKNLLNSALTAPKTGPWQAAVLKGIAQRAHQLELKNQDLEPEKNLMLETLFSGGSIPLAQASLELLKHTGLPSGRSTQDALEKSKDLINQTGADPSQRVLAIKFLALAQPVEAEGVLFKLLNPNEPVEIQRTVLETLNSLEGSGVTDFLIDNWISLSPGLRDLGVTILTASEDRMERLAAALEAGVIDPSAVSWPRQVGLMAQANEELRRRFRNIFADPSGKTDKDKIIQDYEKELAVEGDLVRGEALYKQNCSVCHQIGGEYGTAYGPDLASIRNRRPEAILTDILDPNLSIADGYDLWEITMKNGETKQGIIGSETTGSITLRVYGGADEVLSRHDIQSLRSLGMSIMPSGLENSISPEEMRNLLTFIKKLK
jgi:putative membrane-bound dehydrogenase-like protein